MALSERQVVDLVAAYGREYDLNRAELRRIVAEVWREVGGPGDGNIDAWLQLILPIVNGSQQQILTLVSAYLDTLSSGFGITKTPNVTPAQILGVNLRGTDPVDVYTRPIIEVRRRLSEGASLARARQMATERATVIAETDTVLAHRAAAQEAMQQLRLTHYRRVPTGQSCDLCQLASTQRYRTGDLMPIHARCDCRVLPAFGTDDPGRIVNERLHAELKARGVIDEITEQRRRQRVALREHGELGPVLTDAGQTFTGPGDLGA